MEVHDEAHPVTICVVRPRAKPKPRILMLWGSVRCVEFAMYFLYGVSIFPWVDNSHTVYISFLIVCICICMDVWVDNICCEVYDGEESYDQQNNSFF